MTFTEEIFKTDIPVLDFELFDDDSDLSPLGPINKAEAALVDLGLKLELVPFDLNVGVKLSILSDTFEFEFEIGLGLLGSLFD